MNNVQFASLAERLSLRASIAACSTLALAGCSDQVYRTVQSRVSADVISTAADSSDFSYYVDGKKYFLLPQPSRFIISTTRSATGQRRSASDVAGALASAGLGTPTVERRGIFSEHDVVSFSSAAKMTARQAVETLSAVPGVRFVQPVLQVL